MIKDDTGKIVYDPSFVQIKTPKDLYAICQDCNIEWRSYCPICKIKGNNKKSPPKVKNKRSGIKPTQPTPITIDNFHISTYGIFKELEFVPNNYTIFFQSKGSSYFTNSNNDTLIRVSDHWGNYTAHCCWFLDGHEKTSAGKWIKKYGKGQMKIGQIKYSDLKPHTRTNTSKEESRHKID